MKKELSPEAMQNVQGGATPFWTQLLKDQIKQRPGINVTKAAWESDLWCKEHPNDGHCTKPFPIMTTMRYPSDSDGDTVTIK